MRTADVVGRLAGAVALAVVTGLAVAVLARLAGTPERATVTYFTPNEFLTQTTDHIVTGSVTDPRHSWHR
ncbi:MAG TPA: hypothetical protein VGJ95_07010 [Pseudonocardiaceae bacterium]|jgi:hypothetical protein